MSFEEGGRELDPEGYLPILTFSRFPVTPWGLLAFMVTEPLNGLPLSKGEEREQTVPKPAGSQGGKGRVLTEHPNKVSERSA